MAHSIIWLPAAAQDLEAISDVITAHSPSYAASMIGRIFDSVEHLQRFPGMGHPVQDVRVKGVRLREISVRPYRVIYRLRNGHILVLAVVHGARLLRNAMKGRRLG